MLTEHNNLPLQHPRNYFSVVTELTQLPNEIIIVTGYKAKKPTAKSKIWTSAFRIQHDVDIWERTANHNGMCALLDKGKAWVECGHVRDRQTWRGRGWYVRLWANYTDFRTDAEANVLTEREARSWFRAMLTELQK